MTAAQKKMADLANEVLLAISAPSKQDLDELLWMLEEESRTVQKLQRELKIDAIDMNDAMRAANFPDTVTTLLQRANSFVGRKVVGVGIRKSKAYPFPSKCFDLILRFE